MTADGNVSIGNPEGNDSEITAAVRTVAEQYASSLDTLLESANEGNMDLAATTVLTTEVQQDQAVLEMTQGVAKAATDQLKGLSKRIG